MDTMRSKLIIEYNGVEATEIIAGDCDSFTWTDNASGASDTMTLSLSNLDRKWMNGFFPADEDRFKVWIQMQEWAGGQKNGKLYCGCFRVDDLKFTGFPEKLQLSGISVPTNGNFNVRPRSRTWSKTTLKTILKDLSSAGGIELVFDAEDISIDTVNQNGKTDLEFAYSICSEYGVSLKIYNNKMVAYDQTRYEKADAKYSITSDMLGGSGTYSITRQITRLYDSIRVQYTDGSKGDTLTYDYTIPGKSGKRQMFLSTKAESYKDAEKKAKAALREKVRESQKIALKDLIGSAKYLASECFDLSGFGKLDGKYFIESVTHQKAGGKYTVSLTAHLTVTNF